MTLEELKRAAYNMEELPGMTPEQRALWEGLAYCYEWYRLHQEDKEACAELAKKYIKFWWTERS